MTPTYEELLRNCLEISVEERDTGNDHAIGLGPVVDVNDREGYIIRCRRPTRPNDVPSCISTVVDGEQFTYLAISREAARQLAELIVYGEVSWGDGSASKPKGPEDD